MQKSFIFTLPSQLLFEQWFSVGSRQLEGLPMSQADETQIAALLESLTDERLNAMTEAELDAALAIVGIDSTKLLEGAAKLIDQARIMGKIDDVETPRISPERALRLFYGRSSPCGEHPGDNAYHDH